MKHIIGSVFLFLSCVWLGSYLEHIVTSSDWWYIPCSVTLAVMIIASVVWFSITIADELH